MDKDLKIENIIEILPILTAEELDVLYEYVKLRLELQNKVNKGDVSVNNC